MKLTPKQKVLKKYPEAELVKDGWDERSPGSGCFDFAIYSNGKPDRYLGEGNTAAMAWKAAAQNL